MLPRCLWRRRVVPRYLERASVQSLRVSSARLRLQRTQWSAKADYWVPACLFGHSMVQIDHWMDRTYRTKLCIRLAGHLPLSSVPQTLQSAPRQPTASLGCRLQVVARHAVLPFPVPDRIHGGIACSRLRQVPTPYKLASKSRHRPVPDWTTMSSETPPIHPIRQDGY